MRERLRATRGFILPVAMVTVLGVVGLVFLPVVVAGEMTPIPAPPALDTQVMLLTRFEPWMIMSMVLGVLAALIISLLMIYMYIARVRTTEFHRQILLDAVTEFRFRKLMETDASFAYAPPRRSIPAETVEQRDEREQREREEEEQREKQFKELEQQRQQMARREAEILVPLSLSVAGMGITGSFFIELTAILTIIFGILILGLLGVLGTREIAPILAAIAGYVLGKTTSGQTSQASSSPTPQPTVGLTPQPPTTR